MKNPPAFPNTGNTSWDMHPAEGMTLRDWFAGQALTGLLASDMLADNERFAQAAYTYADAMLAARAPKGG